MTDSANGSAAGAGWFTDPGGSSHLRWWDGTVWTEHLLDPRTGQPPVVSPASASAAVSGADQQPLTRRQLRENSDVSATTDVHPIIPIEPEPVPEPVSEPEPNPFAFLEDPVVTPPPGADAVSAPFAPAPPGQVRAWVTAPPPELADAYPMDIDAAYVPMGRFEPRASVAQEVAVGSGSTLAIWLFAVLPVLHFALIWFVYGAVTPPTSTGVRFLVLLGPILVYLLLAVIDRRSLGRNGHIGLAPVPLAIIPPLYLGIRAARVGAAAFAPAIAWLVLQAATAVLLALVFPTVLSALTAPEASAAPAQPFITSTAHVLTDAERAAQLTPTGMAAKLKSDFAAQNIEFTSVTCPPISGPGDGVQVTCVGNLETGSDTITVVVDSALPTAAFTVKNISPAG